MDKYEFEFMAEDGEVDYTHTSRVEGKLCLSNNFRKVNVGSLMGCRNKTRCIDVSIIKMALTNSSELLRKCQNNAGTQQFDTSEPLC